MTDIHTLSGLALAEAIAKGAVSSREATEAYIARIEKYDGALNAVIVRRFDEALKEADAKDAQKDDRGTFHGVPMTVKDAFEVAGTTAAVGYPPWRDDISTQDSAVVEGLRKAGAVIIGKTNTPALCADWQSHNEINGTTQNPWNHAHTPGGSSGGSGAALAAGLSPLEYGSDIGGSIRVPAHYCGLFGHHPTFGIVDKRGHVPPPRGALSENGLSVVGPLARTVDDMEQLLNATLGLPAPMRAGLHLALQGARATRPQDLRIAVWSDDAYCAVDSAIATAIETAAQSLVDAGATRIDARPSFALEDHTEAYLTALSPIVLQGLPQAVYDNFDKMIAEADSDAADKSFPLMQARGAQIKYRDYLLWHEKRAQIAAHWRGFFEQADVLLAPITPTSAMAHDHTPSPHDRQITVNGKAQPYFSNIVWPGLATLSGLPATAVPLGLDSNGLPIGAQVIGPAYEDKTPIAVARMLESLGLGATLAPDYI